MRTPDIFDTKPCTDAVEWLKTQPDLKTAWNNCERGDWMWWALMHGGIELSQSTCVDFANDCAARAKNYAAYAAYAAANAAADAAYAAADAAYAAERKLQAEWIRKNIPYPFEE